MQIAEYCPGINLIILRKNILKRIKCNAKTMLG